MKSYICMTALLLAACGQNFGSEDIASIEKEIRKQYSEEGGTVTEVNLIENKDGKLVGFVKVTDDSSGEEYMHDCSADMAADSQNYVWRCDAA